MDDGCVLRPQFGVCISLMCRCRPPTPHSRVGGLAEIGCLGAENARLCGGRGAIWEVAGSRNFRGGACLGWLAHNSDLFYTF